MPSCEDLPGDDCSIYSDKFWELLAKYRSFEAKWASEPGVYPEPPNCTETGGVCPQVVTYLYPDGTLGGESWVIDECLSKGWRLYGDPPGSCEPPEKGPGGPGGPKGPGGPAGPLPSCDELPGDDCSIYSDKFWELLAKYSRFEPHWASQPGEYPEPPDCMEAQETGPVMCPQVVTLLYPDGTLGGSPWVPDPCAPKGWRFYGEEQATC